MSNPPHISSQKLTDIDPFGVPIDTRHLRTRRAQCGSGVLWHVWCLRCVYRYDYRGHIRVHHRWWAVGSLAMGFPLRLLRFVRHPLAGVSAIPYLC